MSINVDGTRNDLFFKTTFPLVVNEIVVDIDSATICRLFHREDWRETYNRFDSPSTRLIQIDVASEGSIEILIIRRWKTFPNRGSTAMVKKELKILCVHRMMNSSINTIHIIFEHS